MFVIFLIVGLIIFFSCFHLVDKLLEEVEHAEEKTANLKCRLFGGMFGDGLFMKLKRTADANSDEVTKRFKAMEEFLKIKFVDESKTLNGVIIEKFSGYRKIENHIKK